MAYILTAVTTYKPDTQIFAEKLNYFALEIKKKLFFDLFIHSW